MIDSGLAESCDQLAKEIQEVRKQSGGRHARYPGQLRARIVAYADACLEQGETANRVAPRLGLDQSTLCRWRRDSRGQGTFRRMAIVPSEAGRSAAAEPLRLVTPHGFVVEGLSVEALAFLLRVIG